MAITRHGRVIAVLVRPDVLRTRRAPTAWGEADRIADLLDSARGVPLPRPAISPERAEMLAETVREGRDGR